jgi:predicted DNA-binding transcriptional regulator YafY
MLRLHQRLKDERTVNAVAFAKECGVDRHTIKNDIAKMRSNFAAPIAWDPAAGTYSYDGPYDDLKHVSLVPAEVVAFALASRLVAAWRGTPLGRALASVFAKLTPLVAGAFTIPLSVIDEFIYIPEEIDRAELQHMGTIINACQRHQVLSIAYQKPGETAPRTRLVHPLGVAFFDYRWILVAIDPTSGRIQNFRLTRIHGATYTGKRFEPPAGFNLARHLKGNFGPYTGDGDFTVVIALKGLAASHALERRWHHSQVLVPRADGRVEITLRLNNLVDIQQAILRCGAEAEPISPPELRASYRNAVSAMLAQVQ